MEKVIKLTRARVLKSATLINETGKYLLDHDFEISEGTTHIANEAFKDVVVTKLFPFPKSLKTLNPYCFENAELPSGFELPKGLIYIGMNSFFNATIGGKLIQQGDHLGDG